MPINKNWHAIANNFVMDIAVYRQFLSGYRLTIAIEMNILHDNVKHKGINHERKKQNT